MDTKKIAKSKSFSKRMEMLLEGIKTAEPTTADEGLLLAFEVAKYGDDFLDIAALAIFVKSKHAKKILESAKTKCMEGSPRPALACLFAFASDFDSARKVVDERDDFNYGHLLDVAKYFLSFPELKGDADRLYKKAATMPVEEVFVEDRKDRIAQWKAIPETDPSHACLRYFYPKQKTWNWDGSTKC